MLLPICDVCNKPVDRIESHEDAETREIRYKVYCHGEVEEVIITWRTKTEELAIILGGRAFKTDNKQLGQVRKEVSKP